MFWKKAYHLKHLQAEEATLQTSGHAGPEMNKTFRWVK